MSINGADSVNSQPVIASRQSLKQNGLGKDAFIKILVTQMKNQDPLEPLKDTEFIGQMAQFSSLEQLTNLNQTMNKFVGSQEKSPLIDHADLIGKRVYWEQEVNGEVLSGEGLVKALAMKNGELMVELDNNKKIATDFIHRIEKQVEIEDKQELV